MHPVGFVGVAIVVLVQNACKPMRTPSVFREDRSPIPFVLVGQQQLGFRSKTLPFGRFPLRFQHVDIGVNRLRLLLSMPVEQPDLPDRGFH